MKIAPSLSSLVAAVSVVTALVMPSQTLGSGNEQPGQPPQADPSYSRVPRPATNPTHGQLPPPRPSPTHGTLPQPPQAVINPPPAAPAATPVAAPVSSSANTGPRIGPPSRAQMLARQAATSSSSTSTSSGQLAPQGSLPPNQTMAAPAGTVFSSGSSVSPDGKTVVLPGVKPPKPAPPNTSPSVPPGSQMNRAAPINYSSLPPNTNADNGKDAGRAVPSMNLGGSSSSSSSSAMTPRNPPPSLSSSTSTTTTTSGNPQSPSSAPSTRPPPNRPGASGNPKK